MDNYDDYITNDTDEGEFVLTDKVPGRQVMKTWSFTTMKDAKTAVDLAFAAFESGKWQKQQEVRDVLGIISRR